MDQSQCHIAIVGAGPSGLLLARILELAGIEYIIFERDESATLAADYSSSGTLDIHKDTGQVALEDAGLMDEFRSAAQYFIPVKIADRSGTVYSSDPGNQESNKPEIDRRDLRRILLSSIPATRIRWGMKIGSLVKNQNNTMRIILGNGEVASGFRLIIGADGAWSRVREFAFSSKPTYSGICSFGTFIKSTDPNYSTVNSMVAHGNYLALSQGCHMFFHYLADGSYHFAVGLGLPKERLLNPKRFHEPQELWESLLCDEFSHWSPHLRDLIRSNERAFRAWPFYSFTKESLPSDYTPGIVLLGDAAHLTVPAGDGVNNALYDGLVLGKQITKYGIDGLESAVQEYEAAARPRSISAIRKGQWFADNFFRAESPMSFFNAIESSTKW